jgi:hypothetical protein
MYDLIWPPGKPGGFFMGKAEFDEKSAKMAQWLIRNEVPPRLLQDDSCETLLDAAFWRGTATIIRSAAPGE